MTTTSVVRTYDGNERVKIISDPIHNYVEFEDWFLKIVDTPQFQRLREIRQLGCLSYVFPSVTHSRFEHSLGVGYLAKEMITHFQREQPELNITDKDIKCVALAGLCHDLGHGPFSHVFDGVVIPRMKPGARWSHEKASEMLFDHLVAENGIDYLDKDDIKLIKSLISGDEHHPRHKDQGYLFEIVANKRNSVDVDKFDYLARDRYYLGHNSRHDFDRLMRFSRVINGHICYSHKEWQTLQDLFHTRYSMHKKMYTHRVAKAVEFMIFDILKHADGEHFNISNAIYDPKEYMKLDDTIIRQIENSSDPSLEKSRGIIKRLRCRDLYKFVDERLIPERFRQNLNEENEVTPQKIIEYDTMLEEDDVIVDYLKIHYGMKHLNPLERVSFYNLQEKNKAFELKGDVSCIVPKHYDELVIRIFTRNPEKCNHVRNAFRKYLEKNAPLLANPPGSEDDQVRPDSDDLYSGYPTSLSSSRKRQRRTDSSHQD